MKPKATFRKKQKREKKVKEGWEEGRKARMDSRKEQNSLHHSKLRLEKAMTSHTSILAW